MDAQLRASKRKDKAMSEVTTEDNDDLHELAAWWRESAGELRNEAEKEIERLQEMHRKNVYTIRMFRAAQFGDYERQQEALATLLNSLEQRSMAALGAKE